MAMILCSFTSPKPLFFAQNPMSSRRSDVTQKKSMDDQFNMSTCTEMSGALSDTYT